MTIYGEVKGYLHQPPYSRGVLRSGKPGSKKGVPKAKKRALDAGFGSRLDAAMQAKGLDVPALAKNVRCTRAALHRLLKNSPKSIDAILLFEIATALEIAVTWLLFGRGSMTQHRELTPDEDRALNTYALLSPSMREHWLSSGEDLRTRQPALLPTRADPHPTAPKPPIKVRS